MSACYYNTFKSKNDRKTAPEEMVATYLLLCLPKNHIQMEIPLHSQKKNIAAFRNTESTAKLPAAGSMCTGGHYDHDISSLSNFV